MSEIHLAFVWHHHQPFYKDLWSGSYRLPWVRLHGTKDYYGLARLIGERDGAIRSTVNLVPSLIDQLLDTAAGRAPDPQLLLSQKPADELTLSERETALTLLFMADFTHVIGAFPRYRELLEKRRPGKIPAKHVIPEFSVADFRDLQVLANLAWFHRTLLAEDPLLKELVARGRGYTEEDKTALLDRQQEVVGRVLPLHAELASRGILGISSSPYYHPILPLLTRMESARVAMPGTRLPAGRRPLPEDAQTQLDRAMARHEATLGRRPLGLWPSEGSVSPEILPLVQKAGFSWLASDRDVLAASRGAAFCEEDVYRPWRLNTEGGSLSIVFRDHQLSDLIGFDYQRMPAGAAARDFVSRLRAIGRATPEDPLVTVILDGENPWEHYPDGGVPFLRALFTEIERAPDIRTVILDEELQVRPPTRDLETLHSGSWIHSDFGVWIGHPEDVRAWEYLFRVRQDLVSRTGLDRKEKPSAGAIASAFECLFAAEGSDWTWWYGDDRTSGHDELFDELYRTHLENVYRFLGVEVPSFLSVPVPLARRPEKVLEPVAFLSVTLDGRETSYFEWLAAGRFRVPEGASSGPGGAMSRAGNGIVREMRFGFDPDNLFLRIDPRSDFREAFTRRNLQPEDVEIKFRFLEPVERELRVKRCFEGSPELDLDGKGPPPDGGVAFESILEVSCPFVALGLEIGDSVAVVVEVGTGKDVFERVPGGEAVRFLVPAEDFEANRWRV